MSFRLSENIPFSSLMKPVAPIDPYIVNDIDYLFKKSTDKKYNRSNNFLNTSIN